MKERISGKSPFKRFEEGEIFRGKIIDFKTVNLAGRETECVIMEEEDTSLEWTIILTQGLTPLKKLDKLSLVEIVFRGEVKLAAGRKFKRFDIFRIIPDTDTGADIKSKEEIPF